MKETQNEHDEARADRRGVIEGTPVEEHETPSPGRPGVIEGTPVEERETDCEKASQYGLNQMAGRSRSQPTST
jgi:hypothetical protein